MMIGIRNPSNPHTAMTVSANGRALIESFEGFRNKAYMDQRGIWTIGFGHIGAVSPDQTCTMEQADTWMAEDLAGVEATLNHCIRVAVNQNQFDAMASLCYNIGGGAFANSTLLSLLNQNAIAGASNQFLVWDKVNGVPNQGLLNRRVAERKLFDTPVEAS